MATQEAYQLTPKEFSAITDHAWAGETCPKCQDLLQNIQQDEKGNAFIYPTGDQAEHMQELFGYAAEPSAPATGYLDPEDPQWQHSVEHIQERQKRPGGLGTFGPQSGMTRGEPTRDEWQVTSYLDSLGVLYTHKMKLGDIDPTEPREKIEYDIYLNTYLIAIETSPGWHEGGASAGNFPQVLENDRYKRDFAQAHGIDLLVFDPARGTEKFINEQLVPRLRAVGVDAYEVPETKSEEAMSVHEWNEPMGGAPAYQEADHCKVCGKPLVTYTDEYGEKRCGWCNARLGYGKSEAYGKTSPIASCPVCTDIMATEDYDEHMTHHTTDQKAQHPARAEMDYFRCEHCGQLIDPVEEYHEHEGKRYYGRGSGRSPFQYSEQKGSGLDQSQELPLFPTRGKVNTIAQTDEGFDKGLEVPNHLFHEEDTWYIDQTKTCPKCGHKTILVSKPQGIQECSKCGYSQEPVQPCDACETFRQALELNPDSAMAEDMLRVHLASHGLKNEEDHEYENDPANPGFCYYCGFRRSDKRYHPQKEEETQNYCDCKEPKLKQIKTPNGIQDWCENCNRPPYGGFHKNEDHFNGGAEGGPIGDFYTHKSNATQGRGQESPMQTNYGYQEEGRWNTDDDDKGIEGIPSDIPTRYPTRPPIISLTTKDIEIMTSESNKGCEYCAKALELVQSIVDEDEGLDESYFDFNELAKEPHIAKHINDLLWPSSGHQEQSTQPVGDSWKIKTKHIRCPNCGHDKELCDICNYHHHAENFTSEHEKFQTLIHTPSIDALPEDIKAFGYKYGTLFPCPMDIDPEDLESQSENALQEDKGKPCTHCGRLTKGSCTACKKPVCEECWPISRDYHKERNEPAEFVKGEEYPVSDQRADKENPFAKSPMVFRHAG
jgi:ribosomal protein S27AE